MKTTLALRLDRFNKLGVFAEIKIKHKAFTNVLPFLDVSIRHNIEGCYTGIIKNSKYVCDLIVKYDRAMQSMLETLSQRVESSPVSVEHPSRGYEAPAMQDEGANIPINRDAQQVEGTIPDILLPGTPQANGNPTRGA